MTVKGLNIDLRGSHLTYAKLCIDYYYYHDDFGGDTMCRSATIFPYSTTFNVNAGYDFYIHIEDQRYNQVIVQLPITNYNNIDWKGTGECSGVIEATKTKNCSLSGHYVSDSTHDYQDDDIMPLPMK